MNIFSHSASTPSELDFLVNSLRSPTADTTVRKVLGYLYNYLPYVRHEHNLKIVFASFLNSPVCFGTQGAPINENYLIIEVFKLVMEKKLKISQPTLPIKTFYDVISKELRHFVTFNPSQNMWKVLPIISGIFLSQELRDHLYPSIVEHQWFFADFDKTIHKLFVHSLQGTLVASTHTDIIDLSLVSLALKYHSSENLNEYIGGTDKRPLVKKLIGFLYGPEGGMKMYKTFSDSSSSTESLLERVYHHPAAKHSNRLSVLLERLFHELDDSRASFDVIMESTSVILRFNQEFNRFTESSYELNRSTDNLLGSDVFMQQFWLFSKSILFSQVVIFQGIWSRFVAPKKQSLLGQLFASKRQIAEMENQYQEISLSILHCLLYLNFVLASIGQGGFDGYNFIYYVSLELILQSDNVEKFQNFSRMLMRSNEIVLRHSTLNENYAARCKVLFALGIWENFLQKFPGDNSNFALEIYSIAFDITKDIQLQDSALIEASHSVLLTYFSGMENSRANISRVLVYFELLLDHFPRRLTAHQLSVAVETLGKKIMTNSIIYENGYHQNSIDEFLSFFHAKCLNTTPGQRIGNERAVIISSAQPVGEMQASSTIAQLQETSTDVNIIRENKVEKPRDASVFEGAFSMAETTDNHFESRESPNTSREGLILAFLNVVPYLPISTFVHWLNKIWGLIMASNMEEQMFLIAKMWGCLSENLDLNRSEVAYYWWYETLKAAELNTGHERNLIKL